MQPYLQITLESSNTLRAPSVGLNLHTSNIYTVSYENLSLFRIVENMNMLYFMIIDQHLRIAREKF